MSEGGASGTGAPGTGGTGLSSATGLPAPNAGVVGSAPTLDVKKGRRRARERVEVTKSAAFKTGALSGMRRIRQQRRDRALLLRTANNMQQALGKTASRDDGSQTKGEYEAEVSATGLGETTHSNAEVRQHTVRKPGNSTKGRGTPLWLRNLSLLRSQATWNGGDKSGPQASDNQFDTPGAGGRS